MNNIFCPISRKKEIPILNAKVDLFIFSNTDKGEINIGDLHSALSFLINQDDKYKCYNISFANNNPFVIKSNESGEYFLSKLHEGQHKYPVILIPGATDVEGIINTIERYSVLLKGKILPVDVTDNNKLDILIINHESKSITIGDASKMMKNLLESLKNINSESEKRNLEDSNGIRLRVARDGKYYLSYIVHSKINRKFKPYMIPLNIVEDGNDIVIASKSWNNNKANVIGFNIIDTRYCDYEETGREFTIVN